MTLPRESAQTGVLLLHGFTGTPWEMEPLRAALSVRGFLCDAPLLPGHGTSVQALRHTCWFDWRARVDAALEQMHTRCDRVVVVGLSMGALLAFSAAIRDPFGCVSGVVSLACALRLGSSSQRVLQLCRALGSAMPDLVVAKSGGGSDVRDRRAFDENPGYRHNPLRAARSLLDGQDEVRAGLHRVKVPTLLLHGRHDHTCPPESSWEVLQRLGTTQTRLEFMPDSGHLLPVDLDREAVSQRVCDFVSRRAIQQ